MHLFVEICSKRIKGAVWKNGSLQNEHSVDFPSQTELAGKETLSDFLQHYGSLSTFDNVTCSVAQTNFTLVPAPLFSVADSSKFLQFNTTDKIVSSETDYARFNYFNSVGVFSIPSWIKSTLIPKFPGVIITHERAILLRKLEQMSGGLKQFTVILQDEYALLSYVEAGNLKWHISSVVEHSDDVLYHLLNAFERLGITETTLNFYAYSSAAKAHLASLTERKSKIETLQKHKWQVAGESHLQFQLLCV